MKKLLLLAMLTSAAAAGSVYADETQEEKEVSSLVVSLACEGEEGGDETRDPIIL